MSSIRSISPSVFGETGDLVDLDPAVAGDPAGDGRPERERLLVHLLEHEVVEAALLGGLERPVDPVDTTRSRGAPSTPVIVDARRVEVDDVALLEEDDPVGVGEDRGDVAGEERLAVADADDERHVHPGADEPVVLALVHDREGVGALDLAERDPGGLGDVAVVGLLDEVGDRLGVGVGAQAVAALGRGRRGARGSSR